MRVNIVFGVQFQDSVPDSNIVLEIDGNHATTREIEGRLMARYPALKHKLHEHKIILDETPRLTYLVNGHGVKPDAQIADGTTIRPVLMFYAG